MIILRSFSDGYNIFVGTMSTNLALVIAMVVYLMQVDFKAVISVEGSNYWTEKDEDSFQVELQLIALNVFLAVFKVPQWDTINSILMPALAYLVYWHRSMIFRHRLIETPIGPEQANADQMLSMETILLQGAVMFSSYFACIFYTGLRVPIGQNMKYPSAFESGRQGDFIVENLGELEMLTTILSPAFSGFFIAAWTNNFTERDLNLTPIIAFVALVQAVFPFFKSKSKCAWVVEKITFLVIPILVILMCCVNIVMDEDKIWLSYNAYTLVIQILLPLTYFGKRTFQCSCKKEGQVDNVQDDNRIEIAFD